MKKKPKQPEIKKSVRVGVRATQDKMVHPNLRLRNAMQRVATNGR